MSFLSQLKDMTIKKGYLIGKNAYLCNGKEGLPEWDFGILTTQK